MEFLTAHWLEIVTTVLGLLYIWLEYRAHIALWFVGIVMPAMDVWLFYKHGLYGDAGMAVYYTLAAIYGYIVWKMADWKNRRNGAVAAGSDEEALPITHMPLKKYLPVALAFLAAWAGTYYVLITWTQSTVPVLDAFTNALSFIGLWALARKYIEQWLFWIPVDLVCAGLYIYKGIPFKASLYGLYVLIAVMGWFRWKKMMTK